MTSIVLADDHPIVRQGLRALLEGEPGWRVVGEAADGLSAVDLVEQLQPDVAIVDVMMPDLNGLEVVRRYGRNSLPRALIVHDGASLSSRSIGVMRMILPSFTYT